MTQIEKKNQRRVMNNKFDELTKGLAQSTTRRAALKKFGSGITGIALATLGLASKAQADPKKPGHRKCNHCVPPYGCAPDDYDCYVYCENRCSPPGGY